MTSTTRAICVGCKTAPWCLTFKGEVYIVYEVRENVQAQRGPTRRVPAQAAAASAAARGERRWACVKDLMAGVRCDDDDDDDDGDAKCSSGLTIRTLTVQTIVRAYFGLHLDICRWPVPAGAILGLGLPFLC